MTCFGVQADRFLLLAAELAGWHYMLAVHYGSHSELTSDELMTICLYWNSTGFYQLIVIKKLAV